MRFSKVVDNAQFIKLTNSVLLQDQIVDKKQLLSLYKLLSKLVALGSVLIQINDSWYITSGMSLQKLNSLSVSVLLKSLSEDEVKKLNPVYDKSMFILSHIEESKQFTLSKQTIDYLTVLVTLYVSKKEITSLTPVDRFSEILLWSIYRFSLFSIEENSLKFSVFAGGDLNLKEIINFNYV